MFFRRYQCGVFFFWWNLISYFTVKFINAQRLVHMDWELGIFNCRLAVFTPSDRQSDLMLCVIWAMARCALFSFFFPAPHPHPSSAVEFCLLQPVVLWGVSLDWCLDVVWFFAGPFGLKSVDQIGFFFKPENELPQQTGLLNPCYCSVLGSTVEVSEEGPEFGLNSGTWCLIDLGKLLELWIFLLLHINV